jgi:predicted PurR-regulated permease PerM
MLARLRARGNPRHRQGVMRDVPDAGHRGAAMIEVDVAPKPSPATDAAEPSTPEMPLPSDPQTIFLGGLFLLAGLAALYVAKEIVLPIVVAFLLKLLLQPAVRLAERLYLPRLLGALLALALLCGALASMGALLYSPATGWAVKLPEALPRLEARLSMLQAPLVDLQRFLQRAEKATDGGTERPLPVSVQSQSSFTQWLFSGTRAAVTGIALTMVLLFFLLLAGETFLRRTVEVLPRFHDKRQAVEITQQIERDIAAYLRTITLMNAMVGVATAGIMHASGVGDPWLWGVVAFLLNFAPIIGPLVGVAIFVLAGLLSFDSLAAALVPAALYFAVHIAEGQFITPMLLARRLTLNPVLVILTLVFWYWMWGVAGAMLGVPMLAIAKIICDRVRPLMAFGHFLGG